MNGRLYPPLWGQGSTAEAGAGVDGWEGFAPLPRAAGGGSTPACARPGNGDDCWAALARVATGSPAPAAGPSPSAASAVPSLAGWAAGPLPPPPPPPAAPPPAPASAEAPAAVAPASVWAEALGEVAGASHLTATVRDLFVTLAPAQRPQLYVAACRLRLSGSQPEPRALALRALADHLQGHGAVSFEGAVEAAERLLAGLAGDGARTAGASVVAGTVGTAFDWTRAMLIAVATRVDRGQRATLVETARDLRHSGLAVGSLAAHLEGIFVPEAPTPAPQPAAVPAEAPGAVAGRLGLSYADAFGLDHEETVMSAARRRGAALSIRRLVDKHGPPATPAAMVALGRFVDRHCAAAQRQAVRRVLNDPAFADNQRINLDVGDDRLDMGTRDVLALVWRAAELAPLAYDDKGNICHAVVAGLMDCWNAQAAANFARDRASGRWSPEEPRPILVHCDFGRIVRLLEALGGFLPEVNIVMSTPRELCCEQAKAFAAAAAALPAAGRERRAGMAALWDAAMERGAEEMARSWDGDAEQLAFYRQQFLDWVRMDYADDFDAP